MNLLDAYGNFSQVREIAEKSFAFRETAHQIAKLDKKRDLRKDELNKKLEGNEFGLTVESAQAFERLTGARTRLQEKLPQTRAEIRQNWLRENVAAGRIITKGRNRKKFLLVLNVFGEKVVAMDETGRGTTLALGQIGSVFAKNYKLEERSLDDAFYDIQENKNPLLDEPKLSAQKDDADETVEILSAAIEKLLPENLTEDARRRAHQLLWETWEHSEFIEKIERDIEILRREIWQPFEHRAQVLDHFGYLDFASQKVTERGKWLADVRVDRPLLVGEALRHGLFEKLEAKHVAALMAALAADSDRNYGELYLSDKILSVLTEFEDIVYKVSNAEWKFGVEPAPEMNLSAAATAENWAGGANWSDLVFKTKAEEGDLVRLLSRTGEALLQIAQLKTSNPEAATLARATAEIILREPVR